ncbi:restriction endonuclease subunit S [Flavobacterium hibernum]|nr:restriction endonuclease subunit S [Flavobacterium hibernum]STO11254.1 EcoKI restriction-modification system protein HsdS [Flavobacterium hibernum]
MATKKLKVGNVPNLRFPGFEGDWEVKKLEEVAQIGRGKSKHRPRDAEFLFGGKYPFVQTGDIRKADLYLTKFTQTYSELGLKQSKLWNENTLCITIAANIAETAILKIKACFPDSIIGLIPKEDKTIVLFVKHLFDKFKIQIQSLSQGAAQDNLNQEKLSKIKFVFPSLPEQIKIASFLSLIDERIQTQSKIIGELKLLKSSVVKKFFENKLRFKNRDSNSNWERKKLGEISKEHLHKNRNNQYLEVFSVSKHKGVINQIEHLGRSFSAKEIMHYKLVYNGDLVYTKSPTSEFPFGIIKQNRTGRVGVVSPLYCVFTPKTFALGYLLHEYFNSPVNTFNYLNPLVQKGAKNTMNINNDTFLNGAKLLLPTNEKEQDKIYNILSLINNKIEVENLLLTQYENQKKYLLQNLFI